MFHFCLIRTIRGQNLHKDTRVFLLACNPLRVGSPQIKFFQKTEINQIKNAWLI